MRAAALILCMVAALTAPAGASPEALPEAPGMTPAYVRRIAPGGVVEWTPAGDRPIALSISAGPPRLLPRSGDAPRPVAGPEPLVVRGLRIPCCFRAVRIAAIDLRPFTAVYLYHPTVVAYRGVLALGSVRGYAPRYDGGAGVTRSAMEEALGPVPERFRGGRANYLGPGVARDDWEAGAFVAAISGTQYNGNAYQHILGMLYYTASGRLHPHLGVGWSQEFRAFSSDRPLRGHGPVPQANQGPCFEVGISPHPDFAVSMRLTMERGCPIYPQLSARWRY